MADSSTKGKPFGKLVFFGVFSLILYAVVFTHQSTVTEFYTKGHWYAALPIITVFIFSFVHATFASYLWSVLGISASKK